MLTCDQGHWKVSEDQESRGWGGQDHMGSIAKAGWKGGSTSIFPVLGVDSKRRPRVSREAGPLCQEAVQACQAKEAEGT